VKQSKKKQKTPRSTGAIGDARIRRRRRSAPTSGSKSASIMPRDAVARSQARLRRYVRVESTHEHGDRTEVRPRRSSHPGEILSGVSHRPTRHLEIDLVFEEHRALVEEADTVSVIAVFRAPKRRASGWYSMKSSMRGQNSPLVRAGCLEVRHCLPIWRRDASSSRPGSSCTSSAEETRSMRNPSRRKFRAARGN